MNSAGSHTGRDGLAFPSSASHIIRDGKRAVDHRMNHCIQLYAEPVKLGYAYTCGASLFAEGCSAAFGVATFVVFLHHPCRYPQVVKTRPHCHLSRLLRQITV